MPVSGTEYYHRHIKNINEVQQVCVLVLTGKVPRLKSNWQNCSWSEIHAAVFTQTKGAYFYMDMLWQKCSKS